MDAELLANYAGHLKARGMRSWRLYEQAARRFLAWLSARKVILSQVAPGVMHDYLCHRRSPKHRPATMKAVVDRLRNFFHYAVSAELVADDPTKGVSHRWLDVPGGLPGYQGVLRRIFRKPSDILRFRLPLFAPHWESHLARLLEQGYSKSGLYSVLEHNAHFHRYLAGKGIRDSSRITPRMLEAFLRQKQRRFRQTCGRAMSPRYLRHVRSNLSGLLAHTWLQRRRAPSSTPGTKATTLFPDSLLAAYLDFCRDHGGLRPDTVSGYHRETLRLRAFLGRKGIARLRDIAPAHLDAFMMRRARAITPRSMQTVATALRSFLRYLQLDDRIPRDLAASVLSPSRFRADLRPKYLPWDKIERLLAGVDRSSPAGKRDYAILALLACHGLRTREAARLRTQDLDLDLRCLRLRHTKNGTSAGVPISERASDALRAYLAVRPQRQAAEVFLTAHAPIKPLSGRGLSSVAQRHLAATLGGRGGAYALRHSFAKALLDRGVKLHDIGALLGHKSLRSTLIYTRIATEDMREVADNYAQWL